MSFGDGSRSEAAVKRVPGARWLRYVADIAVGVADLRTPRALTWLSRRPSAVVQKVSIEVPKMDEEAAGLSFWLAFAFIHHDRDASTIPPGW